MSRTALVALGAVMLVTSGLPGGGSPGSAADAQTFTGTATDQNCAYSWTYDGAAFSGKVDCPQGVDSDLNFTASGTAAGTTVHVLTLYLATPGVPNGEIPFVHDVAVSTSLSAGPAWQEFTVKEIGRARDAKIAGNDAEEVAKQLGRTTFSEVQKEYQEFCADNPDDDKCDLASEQTKPADQADYCPNGGDAADDSVFHVCIPVFVAGELKLPEGKKTLRLEGPYGAIMLVPWGSTDYPTEPLLSAPDKILIEANGIFGLNGRFKTDELDIQGILALAGKTTIKAKKISITGDVYSGTLTAAASDEFSLAEGSVLSLNGGGGDGGPANPPGAAAPGGSSNGWGGSNGGLGGMPNPYDGSTVAYELPGGPGPIRGNPFDPNTPGYGGASFYNYLKGHSEGGPGGGLARIAADTVRINGVVHANGQDGALGGGVRMAGGGGSGGSVSIRAADFVGSGTIEANGGAPCSVTTYFNGWPEKETSCYPSYPGIVPPGGGGGGRVAVRYVNKDDWSGRVEARPRNTPYPRFSSRPGGAGTLFWLHRTPKQLGEEVKAFGLDIDGMPQLSKYADQDNPPNDKSPRDGTLIVDGGWSFTGGWAKAWPPLGYTPLQDGWFSANRDLVIRGGARVLAGALEFRKITVKGASEIVSGLPNFAPVSTWCTGTCGGGHRLSITADELTVDATSRISAVGTGGAGGPAGGDAPRAPGDNKGARGGYGGSHAGRGGNCAAIGQPERCVGSPGTTYDSKTDPTMPGAGGASEPNRPAGAPGGGVIVVHVHDLTLNGLIAADGASSEMPMPLLPLYYTRMHGAGAGGSVQVVARILSGKGAITARGGDTCLRQADMVVAGWFQGCSNMSSSGGAGGGGRVLLRFVNVKNWSGHLRVNGGRNRTGEASPQGELYKPSRGGPGTIVKRAIK